MRAHNRVREACSTAGTGPFDCEGAPAGFVAFGDRYANDEEFYYTRAGGAEFEVGKGKYDSANNQVVRLEVHESSNGDALVDFSVASTFVWVDHPAESDNALVGLVLALRNQRVTY